MFFLLICFFLANLVKGQDLVEGLPTQIIDKLRRYRNRDYIDLSPELQSSYNWAKTQPGFDELGFPLDETFPGLPIVGDLSIHVEDLLIRKFDAFKENGAVPIVERTGYGYRMGVFNIGLDLTGMVLKTGGFFGGRHEGALSVDLEECWVEVELFDGEALPRITAKVENPSLSFKSPSALTEIMMKPALALAESYIVSAIEDAFGTALRYFWISVNCEAYISAAADALASEKGSQEDYSAIFAGIQEDLEMDWIDDDRVILIKSYV